MLIWRSETLRQRPCGHGSAALDEHECRSRRTRRCLACRADARPARVLRMMGTWKAGPAARSPAGLPPGLMLPGHGRLRTERADRCGYGVRLWVPVSGR